MRRLMVVGLTSVLLMFWAGVVGALTVMVYTDKGAWVQPWVDRS